MSTNTNSSIYIIFVIILISSSLMSSFKTLNYFAFQSFDLERTWRWFFQKCVVKLCFHLMCWGSLNLGPWEITFRRLSCWMIFRSTVITCPDGLHWKGLWEQSQVRGFLGYSSMLILAGILYHLILSLLLLWISWNHRSKPTISKQFSIIYVNTLLFFFLLYFFIID